MSLNFHWPKKWYKLFTSSNVFCLQAWHFRNFQIRANLCSPCHYIFRTYTTKNLKETCTLQVLFIAVIMFTRHTLYSYVQPSDLTVNVHHKQPQQVMDFKLFLLAIYLLWDNFLIPEMTGIHANRTKKTPCQPQSMHSLGMPIAENTTLPQLRDFTLWTRCKWDLRSFGILRSVDW